MKRSNLPLVIALVLFGLMVAVTLLAVDVAIGQGTNMVQNGTFDGLDGWTPNNTEWVTHSLDYDYAGDDGSAQFVTLGGAITQSVTLSATNLYYMFLYANADDPDCRVLHCLGGTCYNSPLNHTGWSQLSLAGVYTAGDYEVSIQWWPTSTCTSTALYVDDVQVYGEPDSTSTRVPESEPELLTQIRGAIRPDARRGIHHVRPLLWRGVRQRRDHPPGRRRVLGGRPRAARDRHALADDHAAGAAQPHAARAAKRGYANGGEQPGRDHKRGDADHRMGRAGAAGDSDCGIWVGGPGV